MNWCGTDRSRRPRLYPLLSIQSLIDLFSVPDIRCQALFLQVFANAPEFCQDFLENFQQRIHFFRLRQARPTALARAAI